MFDYRYVCVLKKGYQDTDTVLSSVTTKVKGIALTNTTELGERVWDVADYIIPPQVVPRFDKEEVQARWFKCPLTSLVPPPSWVMKRLRLLWGGYGCTLHAHTLYCVHSLLKGCVHSFGIYIDFEQCLSGNQCWV